MVQRFESVPHISLAAVGDGSSGTFAVCGEEGNALWYGPFGADDPDHPRGDRLAAATAAAARAVWLAGRARTDAGLDEATLHLCVIDPDIDATALACAASLAGLALDLIVTDDNPALDWCHAHGRLNWRSGILDDLIDDCEPAALDDAADPASTARLVHRQLHTAPEERLATMYHATADRPDSFDPIDESVELRAALEALLLHDAVGLDAKMRHAIAAVVHLAVDTPHGPPEDAIEFLGRLDAAWLIAAWQEQDTELSLIATLAAGEVPALSWCELMFTTALAPWSTSPVALHARRIFATDRSGRQVTLRAHGA
ncbi:hypothetical protein [Nocardia harenae]|uniref:hypothetical protein n=1 Tax=Nocardia harenae TaxID=358707 RepID=UPI00082E57CF|nr:hypothetical protein [Nocardia harenae]